MAIHLIIASADTRFHDFVREQLSLDMNAELVGEHQDMGPNLAVRILQGLSANSQAAVLLDISADQEQGLHTLEQINQVAAGVYVILSDTKCNQEFLLRSMRLGSSDFLQQPLKRAEFSDAMA